MSFKCHKFENEFMKKDENENPSNYLKRTNVITKYTNNQCSMQNTTNMHKRLAVCNPTAC